MSITLSMKVTNVSIAVDFGGHFPSLDNVAALAEDVRQIGKYYK